MRLGKDLVNKPVYTISDGRYVGKAKDIYLDRNLYWMTGIHLGREGIIRRKDTLIPRDSVVVFGIDAILIKDNAAVTDSRETDIEDWIRLDDIIGREVDTPGGTKLAVIGDVILDTEGKITGFGLSKVTVDGPIAENRSIGRDVIIDNGNEDGVMTIDLVKAEQQGVTEKSAESPAEAEE